MIEPSLPGFLAPLTVRQDGEASPGFRDPRRGESFERSLREAMLGLAPPAVMSFAATGTLGLEAPSSPEAPQLAQDVTRGLPHLLAPAVQVAVDPTPLMIAPPCRAAWPLVGEVETITQ